MRNEREKFAKLIRWIFKKSTMNRITKHRIKKLSISLKKITCQIILKKKLEYLKNYRKW